MAIAAVVPTSFNNLLYWTRRSSPGFLRILPDLRSSRLRLKYSELELPPHALRSRSNRGAYDPELRSVLELATSSELYDLESILFGPSYFSPFLKSITQRPEFDHYMIDMDLEERDRFIEALESRFLYLAADARSTLRGWRPSYRSVLLGLRKELKIPCSSKLSTKDLEAEIFVHILPDLSCQYKPEPAATINIVAADLQSMLLKGGQMFTFMKISQLLAGRLTGKLSGTFKYRIADEVMREGGHLAVANLEHRVTLVAAEKSFARVASSYLGLRSFLTLLGPLMYGTFLAEVVIHMLGTDYARILRAIFSFAQIRMLRTASLQVGDKEAGP